MNYRLLVFLLFSHSFECSFAFLSPAIPRRASLSPVEVVARRDFLTSSVVAASLSQGASTVEPQADLPMIRLKLPQASLGREYIAVPLKIKGQVYDFMVDSGLTTELITPHLQQSLGITKGKASIQGLAAGGSTVSNAIVPLKDASLCCGPNNKELKLPSLTAVITDFPQEHIDPSHDPVEGMIGMEVLSLFDCDFDFPKGRLRFYKPGQGQLVASGMVDVPAVVINETGLIGIRVRVPGKRQPLLGVLDCGSSFSAMNWAAAKYFGLPDKNDPSYQKSLYVTAVGVDGRPLQLPLVKQQLTFAGEGILDPKTKKATDFEDPPKEWQDWDPVNMAVGDLPAFSTILGDGTKPYDGPAVLIGLDILAQRRFILETGKDNDRRRRLLVEAKK